MKQDKHLIDKKSRVQLHMKRNTALSLKVSQEHVEPYWDCNCSLTCPQSMAHIGSGISLSYVWIHQRQADFNIKG